MADEKYWRDEDGLAHLRLRRLDSLCPLLKGYLHPGMKVLDVGCGPGPITLDVAHEVHPGTVVGIDQDSKLIHEGLKLVERTQAAHVTFRVGDAYQLNCADATFDLTYSLNLLPWLTEPVRALQEQRRVTKPDGWVVASVLDWDTAVTYPACPAFHSFLMSLRHLEDPLDSGRHVSFFLGQKVVALFTHAGFTDVRAIGLGAPAFCVHPGSEYFEDRYKQYQDHLQLEGTFASHLRKLLNLGVVTEATLLAAQEELKVWHTYAGAFHMVTATVIAGRPGYPGDSPE